MVILYENDDGHSINLIQRIAGNANGNGSPAANIMPTDTGVLNDGNVTYLCPTGCSSCLSASQCDSCADGFVLNSTTSTCLRCKGQCKSCASSDLTTCTDCFKGTYLNSGGCSLCSSSCL
jgi:Tfp pilus assembly protein PilW